MLNDIIKKIKSKLQSYDSHNSEIIYLLSFFEEEEIIRILKREVKRKKKKDALNKLK